MSQTQVQKRFTISEVAADWHELMDTMAHCAAIHCLHQPTIEPTEQHTGIPLPQSATLGLHPITCKLLLISRPAKGRRLS